MLNRTIAHTAPSTAFIRLVALAFVLVAGVGCIPQASPEDAEPALLVIAPIDVSVSWPLSSLDQALREVSGILDSLRAGDRLLVRSITASSHTGDGILLDVTIPAVSSAGQFDHVGRIRATEEQGRVDSVKAAAREQIASIRRLRRPRRTDIIGALYAAAEIAAVDPRPAVILPFTDGRDDGDNRGVALDLAGLDVRFLVFEGAGLAETNRLKALWTERLEAAGARSVGFVPSGQPLALAPFRKSPATVHAATR